MEYCFDGHVNVLSDYKKTDHKKLFKKIHSNCYHLIYMMTNFCQNHIPPAL